MSGRSITRASVIKYHGNNLFSALILLIAQTEFCLSRTRHRSVEGGMEINLVPAVGGSDIVCHDANEFRTSQFHGL